MYFIDHIHSEIENINTRVFEKRDRLKQYNIAFLKTINLSEKQQIDSLQQKATTLYKNAIAFRYYRS